MRKPHVRLVRMKHSRVYRLKHMTCMKKRERNELFINGPDILILCFFSLIHSLNLLTTFFAFFHLFKLNHFSYKHPLLPKLHPYLLFGLFPHLPLCVFVLVLVYQNPIWQSLPLYFLFFSNIMIHYQKCIQVET